MQIRIAELIIIYVMAFNLYLKVEIYDKDEERFDELYDYKEACWAECKTRCEVDEIPIEVIHHRLV
jgi:hypothetical protein